MILIVDNYDSFTYNLVQAVAELRPGVAIEVHRNDGITPGEVIEKSPSHVIISPGPCTPNEAGISVELVTALAGKIPLLGVCLGHQCIAQAYGGRIVRAERLMHGKTSRIRHDGKGVYTGLDSPFVATRYHSLMAEAASLPKELVETSWSERNELMGIRHREFPVEGVQFHPESYLTDVGPNLIDNFLTLYS